MVDLLGPASATNATTTRPSDTRVFGVDPTWFKPCSAPGVQDGTQLQAVWFNGMLAQVRRAIIGMGVTANNADDDMLLKAIQSNGIRYLADTGSANAMVVTNAQPIASYGTGGFVMLVKAGNDVTDATTINADTLGAKNVVHADGSALARGDWPKDAVGLLVYDGAKFQLLSVIYSQHAQQFGQCYLSLSGTNVVLSRKDGRFLLVNGAYRSIPADGVSASASAWVTGTLYYIYTKVVSGSLAIEFDTTGHVTDPDTGQEVKSTDATCALVGMGYFDGSTRHVVSWYNRKLRSRQTTFSAARTTTAGLPVFEINAEIRNTFLCWSGDEVFAQISGKTENNTTTASQVTAIGFDGTTPEPGGNMWESTSSGGSYAMLLHVFASKKGLAEGAHYATLLGAANAGSVTWHSQPSGVQSWVTLTVQFWG